MPSRDRSLATFAGPGGSLLTIGAPTPMAPVERRDGIPWDPLTCPAPAPGRGRPASVLRRGVVAAPASVVQFLRPLGTRSAHGIPSLRCGSARPQRVGAHESVATPLRRSGDGGILS